MPKTKLKPARAGKTKTTNQLARELTAVKVEVEQLREKCTRMNRTLLHLVCPKEWLEEEIDDEEVWAQMVEMPPFDKWIEKLSARPGRP